MTHSHSRFRSLFILFALLLTLSACNKGDESPEIVLEKSKEAFVEIDSGLVEAEATLKGQGEADNVDLNLAFQMTFDDWSTSTKKLDSAAQLSGVMVTQGTTVNADLDLNFVAIGSQYYIKLNELDSNEASIVSLMPFIDQYKSKWLRVAEDFIPQNIRNLQSQTPDSLEKQDQMKALFMDTEFFTLAESYGVEDLDGNEVYHYRLTPNPDAFKQYMSKASLIDGEALTNVELEQSVAFLEDLQQVEFFIDVKDYSVRKALFNFVDQTATNSTLTVDLEVGISDFNKSVEVQAPESYEDFNPLNLIMGLGSLPTPEELNSPADGSIIIESPVEEAN